MALWTTVYNLPMAETLVVLLINHIHSHLALHLLALPHTEVCSAHHSGQAEHTQPLKYRARSYIIPHLWGLDTAVDVHHDNLTGLNKVYTLLKSIHTLSWSTWFQHKSHKYDVQMYMYM